MLHHMPDNLTHCEDIFGWSYGKASIVFAAAGNWMLANYGHRLCNLEFWLPCFELYNTALIKHLKVKEM